MLEPRRDFPKWTFLELAAPREETPTAALGSGADGNARTSKAWADANAFASLLQQRCGEPPPASRWAFVTVEREFMVGEPPEPSFDYFAAIQVGLAFDPANAEAAAFAASVRDCAPFNWSGVSSPR